MDSIPLNTLLLQRTMESSVVLFVYNVYEIYLQERIWQRIVKGKESFLSRP